MRDSGHISWLVLDQKENHPIVCTRPDAIVATSISRARVSNMNPRPRSRLPVVRINSTFASRGPTDTLTYPLPATTPP